MRHIRQIRDRQEIHKKRTRDTIDRQEADEKQMMYRREVDT